MIYRRGQVWWYKFQFAGRLFRESAKTTSNWSATRIAKKLGRETKVVRGWIKAR